MISLYDVRNNKIEPDETKITVELRGLSTDTKPTEINNKTIDNGSIFIEIDTGKIYFYDFTSKTWVEFGGGLPVTVEANIDLRLFDESEGVYSSSNLEYINGFEGLYLDTLDEQAGDYTGIFDYVIINADGNILQGQIKNADESGGDFYYNN